MAIREAIAEHQRGMFPAPYITRMQPSYNLKLVAETRRVSEAPDEKLLKQLRGLEVKMGLVLTLVRLILSHGCIATRR